MTEADLQAEIVKLAESLGLAVLHVREPRREGGQWAGFPDLMVFGPGAVLFRELKVSTGLRCEQKRWAWILGHARQDHGVWRPADWRSGRIRRELEALADTTAPVGDSAGHEPAPVGTESAREQFYRILYASAGSPRILPP